MSQTAISNVARRSTKRWVIRRKAAVIMAIQSGEMSREDAKRNFKLTEQELSDWEQNISQSGMPSLRVTRLQESGRLPQTAREMLESSSALDSVESFGALSIDYGRQAVEIGGVRIPFTQNEYDMLELLILCREETITKKMFLDYLYTGKKEPGWKIMDVFMCKVRAKLKAHGAAPIETVWGRGYVFVESHLS